MLQLLDIFFFIFHGLVILFNLCGWAWKKTRKANLIVLSITAFSWVILGIWYGFGYCFCTDWHYQVRMKLGHYDMPSSYIKFLLDSLSGWDFNSRAIDILTLSSFLFAFAASLVTNFMDFRRKQAKSKR